MRIIIAGSRTITDYERLQTVIACTQWEITCVVSGGAKGVDALGERWATENQVAIMRFPAAWKLHGRAAGILRNEQMADFAQGLVALWDGQSPGTWHMIRTMYQDHKPVFYWNTKEKNLTVMPGKLAYTSVTRQV